MTEAAEMSSSLEAEAPVVLPQKDVVIIREHELDCDLATAIRRVRADEVTSRSRILVIGPDSDEGGATPALSADELPTPKLPVTLAQLGRLREVNALEEVGQRLLPLLGCLDRFSEEGTHALEELDEAISDQSRARLSNQVRVLREIMGWSRTVGDDLRVEVNAAANGHRLVDTWELCAEMGRQLESHFPDLRVQLGSAGDVGLCRGRAPDLAEAIFLGYVLAAHRIGGQGSIQVERSCEDGFVVHHIKAYGEAKTVVAPELVARFRELVVTDHHGRIRPDLLGKNATSLTLELPLPEFEISD